MVSNPAWWSRLNPLSRHEQPICERPSVAVGHPSPGMYGDRDVAVQAPQDVLERSPAVGARPPRGNLAASVGPIERRNRPHG